MSGVIIDGKFCENTDLICRHCNSHVWEIETKGNYFQTCNQLLSKEEYVIQNQFYFPRVAIAYMEYDNKYNYLKKNNDEVLIFENQMIAEGALLNCGAKPEEFYFIEIDYMV